MNISKLIEKAKRSSTKSLSESDSKLLLKACGVPIIQEYLAKTPQDAVNAARQLKFPVVLKGDGASLLHKTERGLVHLNLADSDAVKSAALAIFQEAGDELEGFLLQPQLKGRREFVSGLFQDKIFGPVVMFGLGGVFAEALSDVVFCIAPLTESDAEDMIRQIRAQKLLNAFRGEKAINRAQLVQTLLALSRIGMEHPEITEIDINPLMVLPDGEIQAADALIITGEPAEKQAFLPPVDPVALGKLIYSKSVAFIGASAQIGKWGNTLINGVLAGNFDGKIYMVNPKGGKILNFPVYQSVGDIPDPIDLAVVTIPAAHIMDLIPQLKAKNIKNMLIISSGFAETGDNGRKLEHELIDAARKADILILGPNTMGMCNPHTRFYCLGAHVWPQPGDTSMLAHSGNMGTQLMAFAEHQGIGLRCFAGSGNEAMITVEDFLDGFEQDNVTRNIVLYIESVKNGRRFFETARRLGKKKPIILLKGGQSQAGNRAAASHTGALSSDAKIFKAMCRQAGIVKADYTNDLLDLAAAFSCLPLPKGRRAAIMTLGGGWGVVTADLCAESNLKVPDLSDEIIQELDKILPAYWSRSNPVDVVGEHDNKIAMNVLDALIKWNGCDAVICLGLVGRKNLRGRILDSVIKADPKTEQAVLPMKQELEDMEKKYIEYTVSLMHQYEKPVFGVNLSFSQEAQTVYPVSGKSYKGIFYPTPKQAVNAFAKMYEYQRFLSR